MKVINPLDLIYEDIECMDGETYMVVHAPEIDNANTFDLQLLLDKADQVEAEANKYPKGGEVWYAKMTKANTYREIVNWIESSLNGGTI